MAERRKTARFALAFPIDAYVSVLHDVQIEDAGIDDITVLSGTAGVRDEEVTVRIGPSDAAQMTLVARIASSEPRLVEGRVLHCIQLAVTGSIALSGPAAAGANSWRSGDRTAVVLVRRHAARVTNLSRGGCLLELSTGFPVGTVATLHRGGQAMHGDPIRIGFLLERRGVSRWYAAGAQFLLLAAPSSHSLRSMAARIGLEYQGAILAPGQEECSPQAKDRWPPVDGDGVPCRARGLRPISAGTPSLTTPAPATADAPPRSDARRQAREPVAAAASEPAEDRYVAAIASAVARGGIGSVSRPASRSGPGGSG